MPICDCCAKRIPCNEIIYCNCCGNRYHKQCLNNLNNRCLRCQLPIIQSDTNEVLP